MAAGAGAALLLAFSCAVQRRAAGARARAVSWDNVERLVRAKGAGTALAFLDARLKEHPRDALLYYYRARVSYGAGDGPAALDYADRAIRLGYAQELSNLLKAQVRGGLYGDHAGQERFASAALAFDPAYPDAYLARAGARLELGNYRGCAADAAAFSGLEPSGPEGRLLALRCLRELGDLDGAEAAGRRALELAPGSHEALWLLGRLAAARGLHKVAVARFTDAIRLSGGEPAYYLDRAASCEAEGDFVCGAWDRAAAMQWREVSDYATSYLLLGAAMHRAGELDAGLEAAETAVRRLPSDAAALELRGRLLAERGDARGARRDLLRAAALAPARAAEIRALLPAPGAPAPGRAAGRK